MRNSTNPACASHAFDDEPDWIGDDTWFPAADRIGLTVAAAAVAVFSVHGLLAGIQALLT